MAAARPSNIVKARSETDDGRVVNIFPPNSRLSAVLDGHGEGLVGLRVAIELRRGDRLQAWCLLGLRTN